MNTPESMRALVGGAGPTWQLAEVPVPTPGAGQILIRTRAVATNNADLGMLTAADPTSGGTGEAFVAGFEVAGEVVAVGESVDSVDVGDAVMGTTPQAFAEYVLADHRHVMPIPKGIAPAEACALPTGLLTEHGALQKAAFTRGQSVLVTGASGGIGLIGVQIAKALGASQVIGTTRSSDKGGLLTNVGVDNVIATSDDDLTRTVLDMTDGAGVDVVLDHVAGQTFAQCLPCTREGGQVVNIGRLDGPASTIDVDQLSFRNLNVHGVSFGFTRAAELGAVIAALAAEVLPAVERGEIRPVIDMTVPWTEHVRVVERLQGGHTVGKIVLRV